MALLTVDDLESMIGEPINDSNEQRMAEEFLALAWVLVDTETGRDQEYWETNGVPRAVRQVVLQLAGRGFLNPESYANIRVDDFGAGGRPLKEVGLYLTPTEKAVLAGFRKQARVGFASVKVADQENQFTGRPYPTDGDTWICWD